MSFIKHAPAVSSAWPCRYVAAEEGKGTRGLCSEWTRNMEESLWGELGWDGKFYRALLAVTPEVHTASPGLVGRGSIRGLRGTGERDHEIREGGDRGEEGFLGGHSCFGGLNSKHRTEIRRVLVSAVPFRRQSCQGPAGSGTGT